MEQKILLDSCVVIDILEKPSLSKKIRAGLHGKSIKIMLCDTVLKEVSRVRNLAANYVIKKIRSLLKREVNVTYITKEQNTEAQQVRDHYHICHNGDNKILSVCKANDYVLVTFDRNLLKTSEWIGVASFHPSRIRGI